MFLPKSIIALKNGQLAKDSELELYAQSESSWELKENAITKEKIWYIWRTRKSRSDLDRLVFPYRSLRVKDVEQICLESQLSSLAEFYWKIRI